MHRDIKAENVLLDDAGSALWADLGVAQVAVAFQRQHGQEADEVTSVKDIRYGAPEEAAAKLAGRELGVFKHSDVFSLGLVLYHMSCGRPYIWAGDDGAAPMTVVDIVRTLADEELLRQRLPVSPHWPLSSVIASCMAHDPAQRPSAEQLVATLMALAPQCHPTEAAAVAAVVRLRNDWMLHHSAAERAVYVAPLATPLSRLSHAPDDANSTVSSARFAQHIMPSHSRNNACCRMCGPSSSRCMTS